MLSMVVIALTVGSVSVSFSELFTPNSPHHQIIWQIRLPRIINALVVGGLLSLAGLLIQNLVKNPLADPYLLGVSGGAAVIQLLIIISGVQLASSVNMLAGFIGSAVATLLLLKISYQGHIKPDKLTLNGVVLAFGFAAIISFLLAVALNENIKSRLFWLMGDLSFVKPGWIVLVILLFSIFYLHRLHPELDMLARGEQFAKKSGVAVTKINLTVFLMVALLTSLAVSQAGTIGFVGLIIPHIVRLISGNSHQQLILLTPVIGACFLLFADTIARTILSPIQLPVGVFTAIIGVPVFLFLNLKVK
ncbi:MAG: iron ABC transporter permease [Proteobacteria bacterium]|nr:iron ABC transporter permease [Pseudomonadota bacterium]